MFNFQGSELIIILLLALVVLGPEKLPEAMRRLGRFYADLKKMSAGFQEEFRAAVDEPTRELRETANTLRDSLDFRKLQDGSRAEKPKTAEMASADPAAVPTDDVPFRPDPTAGPEPTTEPEPDPPRATPRASPPFSGSQAISAKPPRIAPQVAIDDEHGLREARPSTESETETESEDGAA